MSTSCVIHFYDRDADAPVASIYRHCDGYPDTPGGVFAALDSFFACVRMEAPEDTRFGDPSYLSARFVVWQARDYAHGPVRGSLDFRGLGIIETGHDAGHYRYAVRCRPCSGAETPAVSCQKIGARETATIVGDADPIPIDDELRALAVSVRLNDAVRRPAYASEEAKKNNDRTCELARIALANYVLAKVKT